MKIAIVHDSLSEFGGAERVVLELLNIFPKSHLYTSYYNKTVLQNFFPDLKPEKNLYYSWFQSFPRKTTTPIQFLAPLIWRSFNFDKFDLIITSSAYYLSSIVNSGKIPAIHYIHSLPKNLFGLEPKSFCQKILPFSCQKKLYIRSLRESQHLIANSRHTQSALKKYAGVESTVIYPPVNMPAKLPAKKNSEYFLIVSRIDNTKYLQIAVKACAKLNLPLLIAGQTNNPAYLNYLKRLAGPKTKFLGPVTETQRIKLYQKAEAFIFCSRNEDFGIAPVEAMAYGVPIIAYYGGAVKESLVDKKTGLFFYHHSWQSLTEAIKQFRKIKFGRINLYLQAKKFSAEKFRSKIKCLLSSLSGLSGGKY